MKQTWKEKLKIKPEVHEYDPVVIKLHKEEEKEEEERETVAKTIEITDDRNPDYDRVTLKKRILDKRVSSRGFSRLEPPIPTPIPIAPVEETMVKKPKAKKIPKKLFIIEEEGKEPDETKEEAIVIQPVKRVKKSKNIVGTDWIQFGEDIKERLPEEQPKINLKVSSYYLNNREIFIQFINALFDPYRKEMEQNENTVNCDTIGLSSGDVSLLTHQKVIRDYMNLYTPYRGLLLFHGLGSGKTCSSIAIAEGMKNNKRVIVMTPASLRRNFFEELKKCGDSLYKKNHR